MLFWTILLACLVRLQVAAGDSTCLTDAEGHQFVADFTIIAGAQPGYKALAKKVMTADFISITDSINFVDGIPLNTTMTHSRKQLFEQEAKLPPVNNVKDLFIGTGCDTITWYFEFATTPLPTRGIAILFVNEDKKIYKAYREVNSGAVLYNLGQPECQSNFTVTVGDEGPAPLNASCSKPVA